MDTLAQHSQFVIIAISFGMLVTVGVVASRMLRGTRHRRAIVAVAVGVYLLVGNALGMLTRRVFLPDVTDGQLAAHSLAGTLLIILATTAATMILTAVAVLLFVRAVGSKLEFEQERHS